MTAVAAFGLSLLMIESPATPPGTVFASAMIAEVDIRPAARQVSISDVKLTVDEPTRRAACGNH